MSEHVSILIIRKQKIINLMRKVCIKLKEDPKYIEEYITYTLNNFSLDNLEKCFLELDNLY